VEGLKRKGYPPEEMYRLAGKGDGSEEPLTNADLRVAWQNLPQLADAEPEPNHAA
jgi:hypothetical protein